METLPSTLIKTFLMPLVFIDTSDTVNTTYMDKPVLKEADEVYEGSSIKYNFKTQRGFISMAKNQVRIPDIPARK